MRCRVQPDGGELDQHTFPHVLGYVGLKRYRPNIYRTFQSAQCSQNSFKIGTTKLDQNLQTLIVSQSTVSERSATRSLARITVQSTRF